jgi:spermidine synthase
MKRKRGVREIQRRVAPGEEPPAAAVSALPAAGGRIGLTVLVFWAGAALMGLEIAGSRVLAPHFGNSVFVWGSLISVFLIALSVGNFLGGALADRHPSRRLLNSVCIVVSLWIFGIAFFAYPFCLWLLECGAREQSGPLLASAALFLPPSVGMGIVSPFAIRLATPSVAAVGKVSGTFYAISTLGSIAGTLLTTFVLIPLVGLAAILKGLGAMLLLASILTLPFKPRRASLFGMALLLVLPAVALLVPVNRGERFRRSEKVVLDVDTPYHHISVVDNRNRGSRELRFDRYIESAIENSPPYRSLTDYTNYFNLAFLERRKIDRTLFIGAGGAIGPRAFHAHRPSMAIDVVDIDPKILEIARSEFYLETSPLIKTIALDGRMFLRNAADRYDCIVLDAFTIGGRIPFHLVTREFFVLCSEKLANDGILVMNINSALAGRLSRIFESMHRTMESVFPQVYVFAEHRGALPNEASRNIILVSSKSAARLDREDWQRRAAAYPADVYLDARQMTRLADELVDEFPMASRPAAMFTDDYAPIETMPF